MFSLWRGSGGRSHISASKDRMGNPCIPTISRDLITGEEIGTLKTASNLVPFLSVPGP